jgi:hypothetical protein
VVCTLLLSMNRRELIVGRGEGGRWRGRKGSTKAIRKSSKLTTEAMKACKKEEKSRKKRNDVTESTGIRKEKYVKRGKKKKTEVKTGDSYVVKFVSASKRVYLASLFYA